MSDKGRLDSENGFRGSSNDADGVAVALALFPASHDDQRVAGLDEATLEAEFDARLYLPVSVCHPVL